MSPKVDHGTGDTGVAGHLKIQYASIKPEPVQRDDWPRELHVVYNVIGSENTVTLGVPVNATAKTRAKPFLGVPLPDDADFGDAHELRALLEARVVQDVMWADVYRGFIRSRQAPPGIHRFQLHSMSRYTNKYGNARASIICRTKEGMLTRIGVPWPSIVCTMGDTPAKDEVGPADELHFKQYVFKYLIALGLDWNRLMDEMEAAEAFWPRTPGFGEDVEAFFTDPDDWSDTLVKAVMRHTEGNLPWVQMEIEYDQQWGLGPVRGDYSLVAMTPVIVEDSGEKVNHAFEQEAARFMESWGNLTTVITGKDGCRFAVNGKLTQEGIDVAKMVMKPVVVANPDVVTYRASDGKVEIPNQFPQSPQHWPMDGMVCMSFVAERLLAQHAAGSINLTDVAGVVDRNDPAKIVAWAQENVPELAGDLTVEEETV